MKDLTISSIDRQNILNNRYAVEKMQKYLGLTGMHFNNEYKFTIQQAIEFYAIERLTINRYLNQFEEELKHNGYEVLKGKSLKEFKEQFGHLLEEGSKAPQLAVLNFRAFINLGMLLAESEKAKALRSAILDIVIDTLNQKFGGSVKYINQRDEDFFHAILKEPNYRKEFTAALHNYLEMGNYKYAYYTDKIYTSIFKENANEYKKILQLDNNENVRDTMYAEVLKLIASFETGLAHEMQKKSTALNRKLLPAELDVLIHEFSLHPLYKPLVEDACIKMASRDYGFRQVLHEKLKHYLSSVPLSDFERFLGNKSKSLEERIQENIDVFERLKDR
jgi:hypothetical protein